MLMLRWYDNVEMIWCYVNVEMLMLKWYDVNVEIVW